MILQKDPKNFGYVYETVKQLGKFDMKKRWGVDYLLLYSFK